MVSNLKQKPVTEKAHRRTRYKRACQPIMKKFGCTAMQVAGLVEKTFADNLRLQSLLKGEEDRVVRLLDKLKALELEVLELKARKN